MPFPAGLTEHVALGAAEADAAGIMETPPVSEMAEATVAAIFFIGLSIL
ncbi:hypothetical protein ACFV80_19620 [Streptomyces sp. NPDC059862]